MKLITLFGACMEVHRELGKGFTEIVYGDALEIEFKRIDLNYQKEVRFNISYKGIIIPHQ